MDKLIVKLLKENGRIIIPDFGAFIVKQKSPFKVIFNEFLQYNDGALISALSELEKISQEEATEKIKQLTSEFSAKLNAGEQIELAEIGILTKSQTGKITLSESSGEPEKTQAPTKPKPEIKDDKGPIEFDLSDKKPEESSKKEEPKKAEPEKVVEKPIEKKTEPIKVQKEEVKAPPVTHEKPVTPIKETPPVTEYYKEESSKNWTSIILWIFVILIVNGAIFGFFFYGDEIKTFFGKDKTEEPAKDVEIPDNNQTPTKENDLIQSDTGEDLVIEEPTDEGTEIPSETPTFPGTKYYVVAGVFREESNADRLVIKLRKQGYNNAEKFAKIGQMHAVSYDVFPTKSEADRFMMKIKREVDKDAWIKIVD